MREGRIPAHGVVALAGRHTMSSNKAVSPAHSIAGSELCQQVPQRFKKSIKPQTRVNDGGNYCGHDRLLIGFYVEPAKQALRWHVLEEAKRRVLKAIYNPYDYKEFMALMFHVNGRHIRSERLEAEMYQIIPAIFDTVNLVTMQLGYYIQKTGQFVNYCYQKIADLTGMSLSRVTRNMRHLIKAKLIDVETIKRPTENGWKTDKVIISVSDRLFSMFNLHDPSRPDQSLFLIDREKAFRNKDSSDRRNNNRAKYLSNFIPPEIGAKKRAKMEKKNRDTMSGGVGSILDNMKINKPAPKPQGMTITQKINFGVSELLKQFPTMTREAAIKHVMEALKPPPS